MKTKLSIICNNQAVTLTEKQVGQAINTLICDSSFYGVDFSDITKKDITTLGNAVINAITSVAEDKL